MQIFISILSAAAIVIATACTFIACMLTLVDYKPFAQGGRLGVGGLVLFSIIAATAACVAMTMIVT